jgi:hypothetical protein
LLHTIIKSSDYQAHFTAVFDIVTSLISLNNHLGPWSVFSAVSVLTIQLSMNSLNIYHQFMSFRDSLPKVRFSRSPHPKRLNNYIYLLGIALLYLHKFCVDVILKYVSVENQLAPGQIGISPLTKTHRRIMQHSPVRSIIIWS